MKKYSLKQLTHILQTFKINNGRNPTVVDFERIIPNKSTFIKRFGSWQKALLAAGLIDVINPNTTTAKGRKGELFILGSYKTPGAIDLSGKNPRSPIDHICPKKYMCDVKISKLGVNNLWSFSVPNEHVEILQLIGCDSSDIIVDDSYNIIDHLIHIWQISPDHELCKNSRIVICNNRYSLAIWKEFEVSIDKCIN